MNTCTDVYIYVYICIYICIYIYAYAYKYTYMYTPIYMYSRRTHIPTHMMATIIVRYIV